jgi:hypothetical protein
MNAGLFKLLGSAGGRRETFDLIAGELRPRTDDRKCGRFTGPGDSLNSLHPVVGGQHFFDDLLLPAIEVSVPLRQGKRVPNRQHRFDLVLSISHLANDIILGSYGLGRCELPACLMRATANGGELPSSMTRFEIAAHERIGCFAHSSAKRITHQEAFVHDRLALKVLISGERNGLLSPQRTVAKRVQMQGAFAGCMDNRVGLIAEVRPELPVGGENFLRRQYFL